MNDERKKELIFSVVTDLHSYDISTKMIKRIRKFMDWSIKYQKEKENRKKK